MRRITSVSTDDESEVNITPLIDIVFIMLIFFIVTATFVKEAGIDVNKPDAPTAEVRISSVCAPKTLRVPLSSRRMRSPRIRCWSR